MTRPLYCPECDHPTAANGACYRCHPIDPAIPSPHTCDYRVTRQHRADCAWASRNGGQRPAQEYCGRCRHTRDYHGEEEGWRGCGMIGCQCSGFVA